MRKIRSAYRLALTVILTGGHFWFWQFGRLFVGSSHSRQLRWRNKCVGAWARSLGATAGMRITVDGKPPEPPFFLVANHLSYIDIIALSMVTDCVFIAKSEIEGWPGVGFMARSIGTIFIERSNFQDIPRVISRIEQALDEGKGIILFAEGTSGKGDKVLPFSSALLEPAARLGLPVSHASITYRTPSDEVPAEQAVCWWGDMTMFPHLIELLKVQEFDAAIRFGSEPICDSDRKTLSRRLWQAVSESFVPVGVPAEAFFSRVAQERVSSGNRRWLLLVMMCGSTSLF